MYGDKYLEFEIPSRDAAASTTRALPLGQAGLAGDTSGMGPYEGLFALVIAHDSLPANFKATLETGDTKDGAFTAALASPPLAGAAGMGTVVMKMPLPFGVKNWLRFKKTTVVEGTETASTLKVTAVITRDVDKWLEGLI
jgi:hypothetical protein